jgi:peptidoglycan/LPS O-acetylase OafA/YrhL
LAIGGVLGVHAGVPYFHAGWLGVDLFFVLSGFLITSLICNEIQTTGRFNFISFWRRRALRILPPYYLYVSIITLLMALGFGTLAELNGYTPRLYVASLWFYFVNYIPQGSIWTHQMLTLHLWSLAVEEQFYLLWPLLFICFSSVRQMLIVSVLLTIGVMILRFDAPLGILLSRLYTRGLPIFVGCTAALILAVFRPTLSARFTNISLALAAISTIVMALLYSFHKLPEEQAHRIAVPILVFTYAMMISGLWSCRSGHAGRILTAAPLVYIGKISYGIYLYHMAFHELTWKVLLVGIDQWPSVIKFPIRLLTFLTLSIGVAALSHHFFEKPFLRLKNRFRPAVDPVQAIQPLAACDR